MFVGTDGTDLAGSIETGCAGSLDEEVFVMIDPTSARNDRLRDSGRWGYTGEPLEDPAPVEETGGMGRWLLWVAVIALAVIAVVMLTGSVI
jgi:hypothetical protein